MDPIISAKELSIVIVISDFNKNIIDNLLQGALDAFSKNGGNPSDLIIYRVPGAFEIPGAVVQAQKYHSPDAIIAIGAVIRGETPHFDFIAGESARGIAEISRSSDIPIINGIITTNSARHAFDRSVPGKKNKGWEAMESALQTISVYKSMRSITEC